MITLELASLYTVPLNAVNDSSRPIPFESNRIGQSIRIRIEYRSFAGPYKVFRGSFCLYFIKYKDKLDNMVEIKSTYMSCY